LRLETFRKITTKERGWVSSDFVSDSKEVKCISHEGKIGKKEEEEKK
jgi:hypothetical protein